MPRARSDLGQARLLKEVSLARIRRAQANQAEGKLLPRDLVQGVWASAFASLRDRALGIPDRVCQRCGSNAPVEELRSALESEIHSLLEVVSSGNF